MPNTHHALKISLRVVSLLLGVWLAAPAIARAAVVYQDFEPGNGSDQYGWSVNNSRTGFSTGAAVGFVKSGFPLTQCGAEPLLAEPVHAGARSWKMSSSFNWSGTGVQSQTQRWDISLQPEQHDRLTFWVYALPQRACYVYGWSGPTDNNVGVRFFDHGAYQASGYEVWTTQTAHYAEWTKLAILFDQLPPDFDLHHVDKIEFVNYNPGDYYLDDIMAVREDHAYQTFEPERRAGSTVNEYGWKWLDADAVGFSVDGEPVHEGRHAWKLVSTAVWGGTGIQSQEQRYLAGQPGNEQTFWSVDLDPARNDRLVFWVYAQPANGLDNSVGVQFYDHGAHATDDTKVTAWTTRGARTGQWTRLSVRFADLDPTLNLRDLNKIQFQSYWPGTYYFDDLRATGPWPEIDLTLLPQGTVRWNAIAGAAAYRLQESTGGPDGPWLTTYRGPALQATVRRLGRAWYRVRWEEDAVGGTPGAYVSDWSDATEYAPPPVLIDRDGLSAGALTWTPIPQTSLYEVQRAPAARGPWTTFYQGSPPASGLPASSGEWYRVRGARERNGAFEDVTPWGPVQTNAATQGFVQAAGTVLRDRDGSGDVVTLRGVNLGGYLLIEKWMTGLGDADQPAIEDDWTLRSVLEQRFGAAGAAQLLAAYQEAYLQPADLDRLGSLGVTVVRLPLFYRNLQDDAGNWLRDSQGDIDFGKIDWVVQQCAARGLYVLLDLHGAPGGQSAEATTGRIGFNKLFESSPEGAGYRARTIELWRVLAQHYRDNPWVLGYDLLNEPFGTPSNDTLWMLYDQLYQAVRAIDSRHLIVLEGTGDWDTLPIPATRGWQNVLYEFHYYLFGSDEDAAAHAAFIDAKVALAQTNQPLYNVPVLIGEFTAFSQRASWEHYLSRFNAQGWSWTMWTHKFHWPASPWGLFLHSEFTGGLPRFRAVQQDGTAGDSFGALTQKLAQYDTLAHHTPNRVLSELVGAAAEFAPAGPEPFIRRLVPPTVSPGSGFCAEGAHFGAAQGGSRLMFAGQPLPVTSWSDVSVCGYVTDAGRASGLVTVDTGVAGGNDAALFLFNPPGLTVGGLSFTTPGTPTTISGAGFGDVWGTVRFPAYGICNEIPSDAPLRPCNRGAASLISWSDTAIRCVVPLDATSGPGSVVISRGPDTYVAASAGANQPPVLQPIGDRTGNEGQTLSFTVNGSDPDGNSLTYTAAPLPTGAIFDASTRIFSWTPSFTQAGSYPVTFAVSDGTLIDTETIMLTVLDISLPDLRLTALSTTATGVLPGGTLPLANTVQNQGAAAAGAFSVSFHLSADASYGGADDLPLTTTRAVSGLSAGGSTSAITTLTVPATTPLGAYYLCALADSGTAVPELDETNNTRCTASPVAVTRPDLLVTAVSGPSSATRGTNIFLMSTVRNQGGVSTGAVVQVGLYLSTDTLITAADTRLGSRSAGRLAAGLSNSGTKTVLVPATLAPGTYYVGAIADDTGAVVELTETNNSLAGNSLAIH